MKIYKIFTRRIAFELINKGFKLVYTEPNRNNNSLRVFCFEDSSELRSFLNNLK